MKNQTRRDKGPHRGAVQSAFSLIELLTVIAIIGILAAILVPVVAAAREQGKRASCQSSIRQQLIGMHMYGEANHHGFWNVISESEDTAPIDLYPDYVDDVGAFICAGTKNRIRDDFRDRAGTLRDLASNARNRDDDRGGHSYEYFGVHLYGELAGIVKTPATVLGRETFTLLVTDSDDFGINNCPDESNNHGESGWNWGFADGHVRWIPRSETNAAFRASFQSGQPCP